MKATRVIAEDSKLNAASQSGYDVLASDIWHIAVSFTQQSPSLPRDVIELNHVNLEAKSNCNFELGSRAKPIS